MLEIRRRPKGTYVGGWKPYLEGDQVPADPQDPESLRAVLRQLAAQQPTMEFSLWCDGVMVSVGEDWPT